MKIKYFRDTDTLYIELRTVAVAETRDLDEGTQIDLDAQGTCAPSRSSMPAAAPICMASTMSK